MENRNPMEYKPVFPLLMSMAIPPMISMLIQSLYNIIDSMFVARVSEAALAAVSLCYPVQMILIAVACGTGVGVNALLSRYLGEKKYKEAKKRQQQKIVYGGIQFLVDKQYPGSHADQNRQKGRIRNTTSRQSSRRIR